MRHTAARDHYGRASVGLTLLKGVGELEPDNTLVQFNNLVTTCLPR